MPSNTAIMHSDAARRLAESLRAKTWFGFDLDDTLHEFRKASRAATTACLRRIAEEYDGVALEDLFAKYQEVLKQGTSNAFVDGRSSHDYRRERLTAVLDHFSFDDRLVNDLLEDYESTMVENLELKKGAVSLIERIKLMGIKVAVITEGPQDAQERAIRDLGLAKHVDLLATTNHFRVSKTDGLFGKVLEYLEIQPAQMAVIGDNLERDIRPALSEGIDAILYAEGQDTALDSSPLQVNSLQTIEELL